MILNDKTYNTLALIQRMLIPIGTFLVALCGILGYPHTDKITAIISALSVLLATFLKECSKKYFDAGAIMFLNTYHEEEDEDDNT